MKTLPLRVNYSNLSDAALLTFPAGMGLAESSVWQSIHVELPNGHVVIDINFAGHILGMAIINPEEACTPETLEAIRP